MFDFQTTASSQRSSEEGLGFILRHCFNKLKKSARRRRTGPNHFWGEGGDRDDLPESLCSNV